MFISCIEFGYSKVVSDSGQYWLLSEYSLGDKSNFQV